MLEPEQASSSSSSAAANNLADDNHLRLGLNRWLQIFVTQSFYLFLVRLTSKNDEQVTQHAGNTNTLPQNEQAAHERLLAGLVAFHKSIPERHRPDRSTWYEDRCPSSARRRRSRFFFSSVFVRDLILRVMLKIVRLSLKDRPPPNAKRSYTEYKIQVRH